MDWPAPLGVAARLLCNQLKKICTMQKVSQNFVKIILNPQTIDACEKGKTIYQKFENKKDNTQRYITAATMDEAYEKGRKKTTENQNAKLITKMKLRQINKIYRNRFEGCVIIQRNVKKKNKNQTKICNVYQAKQTKTESEQM